MYILQHNDIIIVSSRIVLGVLGVTLMVLSMAASIGLLSYFRIKITLIITEVVPFLVLAVGTNNLFILTHAYEVHNKKPYGSVIKWLISVCRERNAVNQVHLLVKLLVIHWVKWVPVFW